MYKLDSRININRYTTAKNEFGGLVAVLTGSWSKWAEVQDRTGSSVQSYQQTQWSYDNVIVMRYELERPTRSNDVVEYENQFYKINSIQIKAEGFKTWELLQVTKIDESINSDAPMDTGNIKVYNYIAIGGEVDFTYNGLIGKSVFNAFKDGIQYLVITSGTPVGKEVKYNASTGTFTWGTAFEPNEVATILYY